MREVRTHWAALLPAFLQTAGAVALAFAANIVFAVHETTFVVGILIWLFTTTLIARMLWKVVVWHSEVLVITDRRLMKMSGSDNVQAMQLLGKITDLGYSRDLLGRLLGYGDLSVESVGLNQDLPKIQIQYLPRPDRIYLMLCDMLFGGAPPPGAEGHSIAADVAPRAISRDS